MNRAKKRKASHYFYLSPLAGHPEYQPTFIVNRRLNRWRETTTNESGNLADLVVRLYDCTIGELTTIPHAALSPVSHHESTDGPAKVHPVTVEQTHPIRSNHLERFVWTRRIPPTVTRHYCVETWCKHGNNHYHALAFANNDGGCELFDSTQNYRVPPCCRTHIRNQSDAIVVFRHVFDLLTDVTIFAGSLPELADFLVLKSTVAFPVVQQFTSMHAFFSSQRRSGSHFQHPGITYASCLLDHRSIYAGYQTLNDWICDIGTSMRPRISASQPNHLQCPLRPPVPEKAQNWPYP
jgi:hypothetical protein